MSEPSPEQQEAWNLAQIRQRRSRTVAKPMSGFVRRWLSDHGYAETQAAAELEAHWRQAVGPELAPLTRIGSVSRGKLLVEVANGTVMQELHFRKKQILTALQSTAGGQRISDLRLRLAP